MVDQAPVQRLQLPDQPHRTPVLRSLVPWHHRRVPRPVDPLERARALIPFAWVLDELEALDPMTRPMFGCLAVYARGKIVLVLRDKAPIEDSGVWIATTREHHESLRRELPSMRSIGVLGGDTGWQVIPRESDGFEDEVLRACALVRADDPRIGKVPKPRRAAKGAKKPARPRRHRRAT